MLGQCSTWGPLEEQKLAGMHSFYVCGSCGAAAGRWEPAALTGFAPQAVAQKHTDVARVQKGMAASHAGCAWLHVDCVLW